MTGERAFATFNPDREGKDLSFTPDQLAEFEECCGSCRAFVVDFEDKGKHYGHCGVKPRRASIMATDYRCPNYEPVAALEAKVGERERSRTLRLPSRFEAPAPVRKEPASRQERIVVRRRSTDTQRVLERRVFRRDAEELEFLEMDRGTFKEIVSELLDEMLGFADVELGERWQGGTMTLEPNNRDLQAKSVPLETFFKKIVMIRERLRVLEQKLNNHPALSDADKVELQQYITRCYGSLTTFNVLFKSKADHFVGEKK